MAKNTGNETTPLTLNVNGCTVTFRSRMPAGEFHDVPWLWDKSRGEAAVFEDKVALAQRFIELWDLPGDVNDLEFWKQMDTLTEFMPITRWINTRVLEVLVSLKN